MGITTNHIGYIAEDVEENIPKEFEDIVVEQEGIKKLNYVKLSSVCWGAVREIIKENEELKNKVEHLEASGFELQEAIKELVKPKPKAKTKAKAKAEK
jgi:predicted nuclease with TOPRIM domain